MSMEQDDLRSLPKRPVESSTPIQPKKSVQDSDLPMWRRVPGDNKYPLPSLPTKDIQLLVKPLGKSLYESFPNKEFDLSEKAVPPTLTYSSLNDPHLRNYFRSPSSQRHMVRRGFVTSDGRVKTKLEDYNQYRTYLHHLWSLQASQLIRHQEIEEKKRLKTLFEAVESEDPLCKMIMDGKDRLQVNEVMEELSDILPQGRMPIAEQVANPLLQSLIEWNKYQDKLLNDYKDKYPAIKEWLSDQTKNYKNCMENKINSRISKDEKLRTRWEKLRESSRSHLNRVNRLEEAEQENKRRRVEKRQKAHRKMWAKQKHLATAINNTIFEVQNLSSSEKQLPPRFSEIKPKKISSESRWKDSCRQIERFDESRLLSKTLDEELSEIERKKLIPKEISDHSEASLPSQSTSFIEMKSEEFGRVDDIIQSNAVYDIAGNVIDKLKRKLQRVGNYIELQKTAHLSSEGTRNKSALSTTEISDTLAQLKFATDQNPTKKSKSVKFKRKSSIKDVKLLKSSNVDHNLETDAQERMADKLKKEVETVSRSISKLKKIDQKKNRIANKKSFDQSDRKVQSENDVHNSRGKCIHDRLKSHMVPKNIDEGNLKSGIIGPVEKDTVEIPLNQQPLVVNSKETQFKQLLKEDHSHNGIFGKHLSEETPKRVLLNQQPLLESAIGVQLDQQTFEETAKNVQSKQHLPLGSSNEVEFEKQSYKANDNELKLDKEVGELVETAEGVQQIREQESEEKVQLEQQPSLNEGIEEFLDASQKHRDSAKKAQLERQTFVETAKNVQSEQQPPLGSSNEVEFEKQSYKDSDNELELDKHIKELVETAKGVQQIREQESEEKVQLEKQSSLNESIKNFQITSKMQKDSAKNGQFNEQSHKDNNKDAQLDRNFFVCSTKEVHLEQQPHEEAGKKVKLVQQPPIEICKQVAFKKQPSYDSAKEAELEIKTIQRNDKEIHLKQIPIETAKKVQLDQIFDSQFKQQPAMENAKSVQLEQHKYSDNCNNVIFGQGFPYEIQEKIQLEEQSDKNDVMEIPLQQHPPVRMEEEFEKEIHRDNAKEAQFDQQPFGDDVKEVKLQQQPFIENSYEEVQFKKKSYRDEDSEYKLHNRISELVETAKEMHKIKEQESVKNVPLEQQPSLGYDVMSFPIVPLLNRDSTNETQIYQHSFDEAVKEIQLEQQPSIESSNEVHFKKKSHRDNDSQHNLGKHIRELVNTAKEIQDMREQENGKEVHLDQQPSVEREDKFTSERQVSNKEVKHENQPLRYRAEEVQAKKHPLAENAKDKFEKLTYNDNARKNMLTKQISELLETAKEVKKSRDLLETEKEVNLKNQCSAEISPQNYKEYPKGTRLELETHVEATENMQLEKQLLEENSKGIRVEHAPSVDAAKENNVQQHTSLVNAKEVNLEKQPHKERALDAQSKQHPSIAMEVIGFDEQPEKHSNNEVELEKQMLIETPKEIPLEKQLTVESTKEFNFEKQPHRDSIKDYELKKDIRELVGTAKEINESNEIPETNNKIQLQQQSSVESPREIMPQLYSDGLKREEFGNETHKGSAKEPQLEKQLFVERAQEVYLERQPAVETLKKNRFEQDLSNKNGKEVKNQKQPDGGSIEHIQLDEQPVIARDNAKEYELKDDIKKLVETAKEVSQNRDLVENSKDSRLEQQSSAENVTHLHRESNREGKLANQLYKHSAREVQFEECPSVICIKYVKHMEQPNADNVRGSKLENDTLVDSAKEVKFESQLPKYTAEEKHFEKQAITVGDKGIHVEKGAKETLFKHQKLVVKANEISLKSETLRENPKTTLIEQQTLKKIDMTVQFEQLPLSEDAKKVLKQPLVKIKNVKEICFQQLPPEENASEFQLEQLSLVDCTQEVRFVQDLLVESGKDFERIQNPLKNTAEEVRFGKKSLVESSKLYRQHLEGSKQAQIENEEYCFRQKSKLEAPKLSLILNKNDKNEQHPLVDSRDEVKFPNNSESDYDCSKIPDNQEILKDNSKKIPKRYSFLDADDLTVARKYMYEIPDCVEKGKTTQKKEISVKDLERNKIETKKIHSLAVTETIQIESVDESPLQPKANYKNLEKSNNKKILENKNTFMLDNREYNKNVSQSNSGFKRLIKISENKNVAKKFDTSPKRNLLAEMNDLEWPLKLKTDMEHSMSKTEQNLCSRFKQKQMSQIDLTQKEYYTELHSESMARIANYQDDRKLREKLSNPFYKEMFEQQQKKLNEDLIRYILSSRTSFVDSSVGRAVDCSWSRRTSHISESRDFTNSNKSQDKKYSHNIFNENKRKLDEELAEYISNRKGESRASIILAKNHSQVVNETNMEGIEESVKESAFDNKESEDELEKVNKADMNKMNEMPEIRENKGVLDREEHTDEMDRKYETAFDVQKHEADTGEKVNERAIKHKEICDAKELEHGLKQNIKFQKKHEANVDLKESEEPSVKNIEETSLDKTIHYPSFVQVLLPQETTMEGNLHTQITKEPKSDEDEEHLRVPRESDEKDTSKSPVQDLLLQETTLKGILHEIIKESKDDKDEKCLNIKVPTERNERDTSGESPVQDLLLQETTLGDIFHEEFTKEPISAEDEKYPHPRVPSERDDRDTTKISVQKPVYFARLSLPWDPNFDNTHHVKVSATSPPTEVNEVVKQYDIFITDENQEKHSPANSSKGAAKIEPKAKPSLVSKISVAERNLKSDYNDRRSVVSKTETEIMQIEPYNFQNKKEIDVFSSDKKTRSNSPETTNDDALSLVPILSEPLGRPNLRTKSSSYRNRLKKSESKKISKRPKKSQSKTPIHVTFDNVEEHTSALSPDIKLLHLNTSESLGTECSTIAKLDATELDSQLNEDNRLEKYMSVSDFNQAAEELCRMFAVLSLKGRIKSLAEQHRAEHDKTNDLAQQQVSNAAVQEGTSIEVLESLMSALSLGITNYFDNRADNFEVATSNVRRSYFPEDQDLTCNLRLEADGNNRNLFNTNVTVSNRIEISLKEYLRFHFLENERSPAGMITWTPSELTEKVRNFDIVEAKFEKTPQLSLCSDHPANSNVQEREMPFFRTLDIVNNENTESETKYIDSSLFGTGNNDILEPKQFLEPVKLLPRNDKASAINFIYLPREPSHNQDKSRKENQQEESDLDISLLKEEYEEPSSIDVHSSPPAESPLKIEQNGDVKFKENQTMTSGVLVIGISQIEPLVCSSRVSRMQNRLTDGLQRLESYISKPRISFKKRHSKKSKVIKRKAEKRIFIQDSIHDETVFGEEVDSEEESSSS